MWTKITIVVLHNASNNYIRNTIAIAMQYHNASVARRARYPLNDDDDDDAMRKNEQWWWS